MKKVTYTLTREDFKFSHIIRDCIYDQIIKEYGSLINWIESITKEKVKTVYIIDVKI